MYVMIFNVFNLQDCVKCASIIDKIKNENLDDELIEMICNFKCDLGVLENDKLPFSKYEEPLKNSNDSIALLFEDWQYHLEDFNTKAIHYHIRVHNIKNDINYSYMHLIGLMIVNFKDIIENKKFSMFIVPSTGEEYPFESYDGKVDIESYEECSSYLSCLLERDNGIIYGVSHKKQDEYDTIVESLKFRNKNKANKHFPLVVFDNISNMDTLQNSISYVCSRKLGNHSERNENAQVFNGINSYEILFSEKMFSSDNNDNGEIYVLEKYLDMGISLSSSRRFGFADSDRPNLAICDYIFETSIYTLKYKIEESLGPNNHFKLIDFKDLLKKRFLFSNIFSFAIFSFILDINNTKTIENDIIKASKLAKELGESLKQIIQNSLQHSTQRISIVSLNIYNNELKINISDLGKKSIIDTFKEILIKEENDIKVKAEKYASALKTENYVEDIKAIAENSKSIINDNMIIDCLFNDFSNVNEIQKAQWLQFRESDSSAHIGLALFANVINKCNGKFYVSSSSNYLFNNAKNMYSNSEDIEYEFCTMPGTNFYISIPINNIPYSENYNIAKLRNQYFNENYDTYMKFLDYHQFDITSPSKDLEFKKEFNHLHKSITDKNINNPKNKFSNLLLWTNFWLAVFDKIDSGKDFYDENVYYCINYEEIFNKTFKQSEYTCEVFAKGFINAIGIFFKNNEREIFFAVWNASKQFIDIFMQISTLLSIKAFPKNLQIFIVDNRNSVQLHLFGKNYFEAIRNSYIISIENGVKSYDGKDYYAAESLLSVFNINSLTSEGSKVNLFPFTSLIGFGKRNLFFERISKIADNEITNGKGYKLNHSHIRIGNKVHLDSFYEMSYLFYRTIMANNVAFYILKDLQRMQAENLIDLKNDYVLFYGYASYSQAILTSLTNILNKYSNKHNAFYASYLYNVQNKNDFETTKIHINNNILMQKILDEKKHNHELKIKVIQIVPISSTLTTFSKMWSEFQNKNLEGFHLFRNYTVFWVRDANKILERDYCEIPNDKSVTSKFKNLDEKDIQYILTGSAIWSIPEKCSECFPKNVLDEIPLIETDQTSTVPSQQIFLKESKKSCDVNIDIENQKRLTSLLGFVHYGHFRRGKNHFQYYIDTQNYFDSISDDVEIWLKKLRKKDIEREDIVQYPCLDIIFSPVHNSSAGFSQYVNSYYFNGTAEIISVDEDKEFRSNFICEHNELKTIIERLTEDYFDLKSEEDPNFKPVRFIFVDDNLITGDTFRKASSLLQSLLPENILKNYTTNLFEKCFVLINRLSSETINSYILDNSNFYSYCNINISNMRKQGDSCVGCKLKNSAERFYKRSSTQYAANYWAQKYKDYCEVSFEEINYNKENINNSYLRMIISHIFKTYINISNNDNQNYFKLIICFIYAVLSDNKEIYEKDIFKGLDKEYIFFLKNSASIIKPYNTDNESIIYNSAEEKYRLYTEFATDSNIIKCIIKIISRPFFIFNHNLKKAVLEFIIILSETVLQNEYYKIGGRTLNDDEKDAIEVSKTIISCFGNDNDLLIFLKEYVFEALSDLNSTYLLRKNTILKVLKFINCLNVVETKNGDLEKNGLAKETTNLKEEFFKFYSICIQKVVDSGRDETRALRMENLLISGKDKYNISSSKLNDKLFSERVLNYKINENISDDVKKYFITFCNEVFLSNGLVLYDGIKRLASEKGNLFEDYFMRRWSDFRKIDGSFAHIPNSPIESYVKNCGNEIELYKFFKNDLIQDNSDKDDIDSVSGSNTIIEYRYEMLLEKIKGMITQKYKIPEDKIHIALLTYYNALSQNNDIRDFEIVKSNFKRINFDDGRISRKNKKEAVSNYKFIIKSIIKSALDNNDNSLRSYGYLVGKFGCSNEITDCYSEYLYKILEKRSYFILKFDNEECNAESISGKEIKRIVPVYIYVSFSNDNQIIIKRLPYMIMRDILSYRNSLIYYFQEDFTSDVMQRYSRSLDKEAILENEKVVSHTSHRKDLEEINAIIDFDDNNNDVAKIKSWVLARNYCNSVIARLYNRVFKNIVKPLNQIVDESVSTENDFTYKLYVNRNKNDGRNIPLVTLDQLNPEDKSDKFFAMFSDIITFDSDGCFDKEYEMVSKNINDIDYVFNLEFVKNIIYRICFDALRFSNGSIAAGDNFINRINNHYILKKQREHQAEYGPCLSQIVNKCLDNNDLCYIQFSVEECTDSDNFDWLVIKNTMKDNEVTDSKRKYLQYLKMKMSDPLDFTDGHMSLITTKEYFLKLLSDEDALNLHKMYSYGNNCFITKLPIINKRKGVSNDEQN